jgi:hypothetical protein
MPREGLEPTIPLFKRAKTFHALYLASTVIGPPHFKYIKILEPVFWTPKIIYWNTQASEHHHVEPTYLLRCRWRWHSCLSGATASSSRTEGWPLCPSGCWTELELSGQGFSSLDADIHRSVCDQTRCSSQRTDRGTPRRRSVMHLRQRQMRRLSRREDTATSTRVLASV